MKNIVINKNDSGQRLDKYFFKAFPLIPSSLLYKAIRKKDIKINEKRTSASYVLCEGDKLYIYIHDKFLAVPDDKHAFLSVTDNIDVIYEDDNIILVNKPSGLVVHGDNTNTVDTLIARIQSYLYKKGEYLPENDATFAPALCNRIDRNTSGIVIAAKNAEALRLMNDKVRDRRIEKKYLLAVHGKVVPQKGVISNYLRKNPDENRVYIENNKTSKNVSAITKYTVLSQLEDISLVEAEIVTGRTHQIRAQFAHFGHSLVGDMKYGSFKNNYGYKFQALVAYKLKFYQDEDAGKLSYLSGKSFKISSIPFADLFDVNINNL